MAKSSKSFIAESDLKNSREYWKRIPFRKRNNRKESMIGNLEFAGKSGTLFEFGYSDVPNGYVVFSDLPKKYQRLLSAYKTLAHEMSDENTVYSLDDFEFDSEKGVVRARVYKTRLEFILD